MERKEHGFGQELDPHPIFVSPFSDCVAWILLLSLSLPLIQRQAVRYSDDVSGTQEMINKL